MKRRTLNAPIACKSCVKCPEIYIIHACVAQTPTSQLKSMLPIEIFVICGDAHKDRQPISQLLYRLQERVLV